MLFYFPMKKTVACPAPLEEVSVNTIGVPISITDMADELRYTVANVTIFPIYLL